MYFLNRHKNEAIAQGGGPHFFSLANIHGYLYESISFPGQLELSVKPFPLKWIIDSAM